MAATVTISIEVELGWGTHDLEEYGHLSERCQYERRRLVDLLRVCDAVEIPVTFDIVGHLYLEECDGSHAGPYPDDWFSEDPGTNVATNPAYYGPDLARRIQSRSVSHELCTHTFSHVLCQPMERQTVVADIARGQRLERTFTGRLSPSFVPPRHSELPAGILHDREIEIVRKAVQTDGPSAKRLLELLVDPPSLPEPRIVNGVVETYCTTYPSLTAPSLPSGQRRAHPAFSLLPVWVRRRLHRRRLESMTRQAIESESHLNLWCHLYDLANAQQWPTVASYLEWLAGRCDRGDVEVLTMEALNDRVRQRVRE